MRGRGGGAPAATGRKPNILTVHCVIHRQHVVATKISKRLHASLNYVIEAVNKIKSNSFNSRLFVIR